MNEEKKKAFYWGMLAGIGVMAVIGLVAGITFTGQFNRVAAMTSSCQAEVKQFYSSATLLSETTTEEKVQPVELMDGLVRLTPGSAIGGGTQQTTVMRWYIPARVEPVAIGGTAGLSYTYVGADGRREGPFVPLTPAESVARKGKP